MPIIRKPLGNPEKNIHYRTSDQIYDFADRGVKSNLDNSPVRASYKIKLNPKTRHPIFKRDLLSKIS